MRLFSFKDSYTALHIAVEHCKPLAVQTLLGFGAKVELKGGKVRNLLNEAQLLFLIKNQHYVSCFFVN